MCQPGEIFKCSPSSNGSPGFIADTFACSSPVTSSCGAAAAVPGTSSIVKSNIATDVRIQGSNGVTGPDIPNGPRTSVRGSYHRAWRPAWLSKQSNLTQHPIAYDTPSRRGV